MLQDWGHFWKERTATFGKLQVRVCVCVCVCHVSPMRCQACLFSLGAEKKINVLSIELRRAVPVDVGPVLSLARGSGMLGAEESTTLLHSSLETFVQSWLSGSLGQPS